jgi:hypothetical protein
MAGAARKSTIARGAARGRVRNREEMLQGLCVAFRQVDV